MKIKLDEGLQNAIKEILDGGLNNVSLYLDNTCFRERRPDMVEKCLNSTVAAFQDQKHGEFKATKDQLTRILQDLKLHNALYPFYKDKNSNLQNLTTKIGTLKELINQNITRAETQPPIPEDQLSDEEKKERLVNKISAYCGDQSSHSLPYRETGLNYIKNLIDSNGKKLSPEELYKRIFSYLEESAFLAFQSNNNKIMIKMHDFIREFQALGVRADYKIPEQQTVRYVPQHSVASTQTGYGATGYPVSAHSAPTAQQSASQHSVTAPQQPASVAQPKRKIFTVDEMINFFKEVKNIACEPNNAPAIPSLANAFNSRRLTLGNNDASLSHHITYTDYFSDSEKKTLVEKMMVVLKEDTKAIDYFTQNPLRSKSEEIFQEISSGPIREGSEIASTPTQTVTKNTPSTFVTGKIVVFGAAIVAAVAYLMSYIL